MGDFPRFRVLGFGVIPPFRHSAIPRLRVTRDSPVLSQGTQAHEQTTEVARGNDLYFKLDR